MIAYISGFLTDKGKDYIIVEVGGIGYHLTVSGLLLDKLPDIGEKIKIYCYLVFKEDGIAFYGFGSKEEKQLFSILISTQGIGPKTAISIMSKIEANEFISAIYFEDVKKLTSLPGIGKKTAQRLILELKDKLVTLNHLQEIDTDNLSKTKHDYDYPLFYEVSSALDVLGYKTAEYESILKRAISELGIGASTEQCLKYVLSRLGG